MNTKDILANRHDVMVLFEVTNGNPNGDPEAGNMPRIEPNSNKGLITDVCLKRKIRKYIEEFGPKTGPLTDSKKIRDGNAFKIMVQQGAVLNNRIDEADTYAKEKAGTSKNSDDKEMAALDWLCREFYDIRTFGGVLSTGNKIFKGSAFGQVTGPVQISFAQSFDPVTPLEISITRCAATNEKEKKSLENQEASESGTGGNRTMGNKFIVPYALYSAKVFVSPALAEKTGFTNQDLKLFFEALGQMFEHDHSSARGEMIVRGIYDFEHIGTQGDSNPEQNKREARVGCWHAHKLFEGITVKLKEGRKYPQSYADYDVFDNWRGSSKSTCAAKDWPAGIKLNRLIDPN